MKRKVKEPDAAPYVDSRAQKSRIEIRVDREQKALLEKAAALTGSSLTSFMLSTCIEDAMQLLDEHYTTTLSNEAFDELLELLAHPPEPNEALIRLLKKHNSRSASRSDV
jgi:uncharacterized protein (DUF1778 family)